MILVGRVACFVVAWKHSHKVSGVDFWLVWKALLEDGSCPLIFLCRRELFVFVCQSSSFREQSTEAY